VVSGSYWVVIDGQWWSVVISSGQLWSPVACFECYSSLGHSLLLLAALLGHGASVMVGMLSTVCVDVSTDITD